MFEGSFSPKNLVPRLKGMLCSPWTHTQPNRQTHRQTHTNVNTEDTLPRFQKFPLRPIIKDRSNNVHQQHEIILKLIEDETNLNIPDSFSLPVIKDLVTARSITADAAIINTITDSISRDTPGRITLELSV